MSEAPVVARWTNTSSMPAETPAVVKYLPPSTHR
jgi:hypothetical protein